MGFIKDLFSHNANKNIKDVKIASQVSHMIEKTPEYASIIHDYMMGDTTEDILRENASKSSDIADMLDYLDYHNITIDQAVAIYQYTVNSNDILAVKRNEKTIEELMNEKLLDIKKRISKTYPVTLVQSFLAALRQFTAEYDFEGKGQKRITGDFVKFGNDFGINTAPVAAYAYDICAVKRLKDNLKLIENVLSASEITEDITVYRTINGEYAKKLFGNGDINELYGKMITNNCPTSTAKTVEQCLAGREEYQYLLKIKCKKGTKGVDVSRFSAFGDSEGEILLAENNLIIKDIDTVYIEGRPRVVAECELVQRELTKSNEKPFDYLKGADDLVNNKDNY